MFLKSFLNFFGLEGGTRPHIANIARPKMLLNYAAFFLFRKFNLIKLPYGPINLMVEVSTKCNLACPACERELFREELGGLPIQNVKLENIQRLAPILRDVYSAYLVSGLGEPFLNPEFWDIHRFFKTFKVKTGYFTNATFLTPDLVQKTFNEKVNAVLVSIDSFDQVKYSSIKKGSELENAKKYVRLFAESKKKRKAHYFSLGLNFIFRRDNYRHILDYLDFAKSLGVDFIHCSSLIVHREKDRDLSFFLVEDCEKQAIFREAEKKAARLKIGLRLPNLEVFQKNTCGYLWRCLSIFYNGDVCPCPFFRTSRDFYYHVVEGNLVDKRLHVSDCIVGNYLNEGIEAIWNGSKMQSLRKTILGKEKCSPCNSCYFKYDLH